MKGNPSVNWKVQIHQHMTKSYLRTQIVLEAFIKDKRGNRSNSGNYRAIALGSLFCKMFDNIVLDKHYDNLMSDELQFGYKKGASTVLCTALLKETIDYYAERDSDCYMLMLDASKAFDRVEYVRLFTVLRERALMNMYVNQCIQIKWNSMISEKYGIANGENKVGCSLLFYLVFTWII